MIHEKEFMSLKETNAGDSSGVFYTCPKERKKPGTDKSSRLFYVESYVSIFLQNLSHAIHM